MCHCSSLLGLLREGWFLLSSGIVKGLFMRRFFSGWRLGFAFGSFWAWVRLSLAWTRCRCCWQGISCRCSRVKSRSSLFLFRPPMNTLLALCILCLAMGWLAVMIMAFIVGLFVIMPFLPTARSTSRFWFVMMPMPWFTCWGCPWLFVFGPVPKVGCIQRGLPWFMLSELLFAWVEIKRFLMRYFIRW